MKAAVMMVIALGAMTVFGGRADAAAPTPLPWCMVPGDGNGAYFCNYYTFEQCRQAARGTGECQRNTRFDWPYYQRGQVAPTDVDPRRYRVRRGDCWGIFCW